jgi:hypothetical protein
MGVGNPHFFFTVQSWRRVDDYVHHLRYLDCSAFALFRKVDRDSFYAQYGGDEGG